MHSCVANFIRYIIRCQFFIFFSLFLGMSLLTFFIIIIAVVFLLMGIDQLKRKQMTIIHLLVYIVWSISLGLFVLFPNILVWVSHVFGVAKWSDVIVYVSIVILLYTSISLSNAWIKEKTALTRLVAAIASNDLAEQLTRCDQNVKNRHYRFAFLVRVYNEEPVIWHCINTIYAAGYRLVLCVNDGSSDNSLAIIRQKQHQYPDMLLLVVSNPINRWPWAGNVTWLTTLKRYAAELSYDRLVMFDPDGQMDIADIAVFDAAIQEDKGSIDVYFGSRFVWVDPTNMPMIRKLVVKLWRLVTHALYGIDVSDQHCWLRVLSKNAISRIVLTADNRHYANQLVEEVVTHRLRFREIPVRISYTDYSLSKASGQRSINALFLWFQMLYQKFFFR